MSYSFKATLNNTVCFIFTLFGVFPAENCNNPIENILEFVSKAHAYLFLFIANVIILKEQLQILTYEFFVVLFLFITNT